MTLKKKTFQHGVPQILSEEKSVVIVGQRSGSGRVSVNVGGLYSGTIGSTSNISQIYALPGEEVTATIFPVNVDPVLVYFEFDNQ